MSKSEKRIKSIPFVLRMAPDEREALAARAADANKTLAAYLIACGLARQLRSAVDDHVINELRRLGELQRALCAQHGGALTTEYAGVIVEIIHAIRRIGS